MEMALTRFFRYKKHDMEAIGDYDTVRLIDTWLL